MSEICGPCQSFSEDYDYPPKFVGWCKEKGTMVAYYALCTIGKWKNS